MGYFQILCAIGVVLYAIYYYYTSTYNYWKNRGIPGPKPTVFVGNFLEFALQKISLTDQIGKLYQEYKDEPMFGIYEGRTPVLIVNDLDLVKDILIRDFSVFVDRGFRMFPKVEPLGEHLFALEPERWRPMRAKLSPIFTSGKLKEMFPLIIECTTNLEKYVDALIAKGEPVECRDLAAKYTTDVIGSCVFGINMSALTSENSQFREMGKKLFTPNLKLIVRNMCRQFMPSLYEIIGHKLQPDGVDNFLINVVRDTIKYREENNIVRTDFINTLIDLKNNPDKLDSMELTNALLTAQAFVFFAAGFETSSLAISHTLYELARHQDVQDKLREEIREAYRKHGETLSYQTIKEMSYLDKVIKETLRLYPVLPMLSREAMHSYTFKDTKVTIEKGTKVWIMAYGIHRDPNIFPDPEAYDPERFNEDAVAARHPMTNLSFGDGPRNCIGARFAQIQSKLGIITLIRDRKFEVCEKTQIPFVADPTAFSMTLNGGVHLKVTKMPN